MKGDEDSDLFMDGTIVLIDTRGHARGHQSVILDLPNSGKLVLAMDAAPDKDMLDRGFPGRPCSEGWQRVHTLRKLKHLSDCGYKILFEQESPREGIPRILRLSRAKPTVTREPKHRRCP